MGSPGDYRMQLGGRRLSIAYFKESADDTANPYQTLINLYLRDLCGARSQTVNAMAQGAANGEQPGT